MKIKSIILSLVLVSPCFAGKVNLKGTNKVNNVGHVDLRGEDTIVLEGMVDFFNMEALSVALNGLSSVNLVIDSKGGFVEPGLAFVKRVTNLRAVGSLKTMNCYITNEAMSMAAFIASYCDSVSIYKSGAFMIHHIQTGCIGTIKSMTKCLAYKRTWVDNVMLEIAYNWGLTLNEYYKFQDDELFLNAHEAVSHGFADEVFNTISHDGVAPSQTAPMFSIPGIFD